MGNNNSKRGVKRPVECEMTVIGASTSKIPNIISKNITAGAIIHTEGNSKVSIGAINQQIIVQQPTKQQPLRNIMFQVEDPANTFCGREKQLEDIQNAFSRPKGEKLFNLVTVCGYGGIGKTELVRKHIQDNHYENVIWIHAESESTIKDSFNKLHTEFAEFGYSCSNSQDTYKYLNSTKCLFVFDNVENMKTSRQFLPKRSNNCLFLVTSQYKTWSPFKSIELGKLNSEDATNVLKAVLHTHDIEISDSHLDEFANKVEPVPLVLQITASYVCQEVLDFRNTGTEYKIEDVIRQLDTDNVTTEFPVFSTDPYMKSVFVALSRTMKRIWSKDDMISKTSATILGVSVYLNADFIVKQTLNDLLNIKEYIFIKALATVVNYSLIQKTSLAFSIHRTVQQCIKLYCENLHEYYLPQALHALLHDQYDANAKIVIQHGEKDFETFFKFYEENQCFKLYKVLTRFAPCTVISQIMNRVNLSHCFEFMIAAIQSKRDDIMEMLRNSETDFHFIDGTGCGVLYYTCLLTHDNIPILWATIKTIINQIKVDSNSRNSNGSTVLHTLCDLERNDTGIDQDIFIAFILLIKQGANHKLKNNDGHTPADITYKYKDKLPLTLELLDSYSTAYWNIPHIAAKYKRYDLLHMLIEHKVCNIYDEDDSGSTVLYVLAGLPKLDKNGEEELVLKAIELLKYYQYIDKDTSKVNNAGDTASDVARRHERDKLSDLFNAWAQPGLNIYQTVALSSFRFMSSKDEKHVNEQNESGCTLLHVLCDLDTDHQMDIIKLSADLVIRYKADVRIKNNKNEMAAEIARFLERHLIADFLDHKADNFSTGDYWCTTVNLFYVALKNKEFDLLKYVWWRYLYYPVHALMYEDCDSRGCRVLHMLCELEDLSVTDDVLIRLIDDLKLDVKDIATYNKNVYEDAVETAKKHGRDNLVSWLQDRIR